MGCKSSKPYCGIAVSSIDSTRAVRREETDGLLAELRSLGASTFLHPVLLAVAGGPELREEITNPDLLALVNDYLKYTIIETPRCLTAFKGRLGEVQDILSILSLAQCFDKEEATTSNDKNKKKKKKKKKKNKNKYWEAVEKLKEWRAVDDPFAALNTNDLRKHCEWQRSLLDALGRRQREIEKKRRSVKKWKKVWDWMYLAGILAVLACSVIFAILKLPTAAILAAATTATAMKVAEPSINSAYWDRRESSLQHEKDVMAAMKRGVGLAVHELDNVRLIVEKLKIDLDAMLDDVDFVINQKEDMAAVNVGIEHLVPKKGDVEKGIHSLKEKLDSLEGEIRKATTEFLNIILKDI